MTRRRQHVPWTAAGLASEHEHSADDVVRETGWVFNNQTGDQLTLAQFVATGEAQIEPFMQALGLASLPVESQTMLELGCGIGRMTAGFTRRFNRVIACDLDAAFLERCRETVAQLGRPDHLQTSHIPDGRTIALRDDSVDLVFSYITLQHCHRADALALAREAVRVARPGGRIALDFRSWDLQDVVLWPTGKLVRAMWRLPFIGPVIAQRRLPARLGWQANRLAPSKVLAALGDSFTDVTIFRGSQRRGFGLTGTTDCEFAGMHRSHWWIVGVVR